MKGTCYVCCFDEIVICYCGYLKSNVLVLILCKQFDLALMEFVQAL